MSVEIQLVGDESGIAVIGDPTAVDRFLATADLPSSELDLERLTRPVALAGIAAEAGAQLAENSGRWVKLTRDSAEKLRGAHAMVGSRGGQWRGIVQGNDGRIRHVMQFTTGGLANPALLAGLGGLMAQLAIQQQMDEISDYLAVIDAKVDDVLRNQKDAVLADMIGVDLVIEDAMTVRAQVGRVGDVTWSKVQATAITIARTQAYALRQLDAIAERLEKKTDINALVKTTKAVEPQVQEWLAVLAHCFRLQDALSVLEPDRVLDSATADLEQHRLGIQASRQHRLELVTKSTEQLLGRIGGAAGRANERVLLNPIESPTVVRSANRASAEVVRFQQVIGARHDDTSVEARRWLHAAGDARDRAVEIGGNAADHGRRVGEQAKDRARSITNRVARGVAERTQPRSDEEH